MARITVEDCVDKINNRFNLVLVATKRARQLLQTGEDPKVAWENDKATVVALREIAEGYFDEDYLREQPEAEETVMPMPMLNAESENQPETE